MTPRRRRRRAILDASEARREGRRFSAFYQGHQARRAGRPGNPYQVGTVEHRCWEAGWQYADAQQSEDAPPPVCRVGPGGDFVQDWPGQEDTHGPA